MKGMAIKDPIKGIKHKYLATIKKMYHFTFYIYTLHFRPNITQLPNEKCDTQNQNLD
jgi:hypothetical protein